jgi:hypothetical protein
MEYCMGKDSFVAVKTAWRLCEIYTPARDDLLLTDPGYTMGWSACETVTHLQTGSALCRSNMQLEPMQHTYM